MTRTRLIVIGPLPPPYHGVTISTSLVLANEGLQERFDVEHLDTSDTRSDRTIGKWDVQNLLLGIVALIRLVLRLRGSRGMVYLPLSQSAPGFLRDSMFVLAASLRGWRVAGHLRGSDFPSFYAGSRRLLRRWIRLALHRVDSVAVMGESLRWVFNGLVGEERIAVVPNGTPEPSVSDVTRDPDHVVFLSNLRRRKGVVQSLEAALLVLAERRATRFSFVGEWESDELEAALRRRAAGWNGRIAFSRPVQGAERDRLLSSASVLLFPPVEPEGHPRVVLEALAAGVPVVTTDRGAIRETVVEGQSGFVLDEPDARLLADRVLTLLDDDALRSRFGRAARQRYLENFTQGEADRRLCGWLESLIP